MLLKPIQQKAKKLRLCNKTVTRRIDNIAEDLKDQLHENIQKYKHFLYNMQ